MEAIGAGLAVEPYLATVVMGGYLLQQGASAQRERLARLAAGELQLAFGFAERQSRYELANVETRAEADGEGYRLTGSKSVVFNAPAADVIAVSARTAGNARDCEGLTVFALDADAPGLIVREYRTMDGLRAGEVDLDRVPAGPGDVLGRPGEGLAVVEGAANAGIVAACAEAAGIMTPHAPRHHRIPQAPRAIRDRALELPGAAAPPGRHVHGLRALAFDGLHGSGAAREFGRRRNPSCGRPSPPPRCRSAAPGGSSGRMRSSFTAGWA